VSNRSSKGKSPKKGVQKGATTPQNQHLSRRKEIKPKRRAVCTQRECKDRWGQPIRVTGWRLNFPPLNQNSLLKPKKRGEKVGNPRSRKKYMTAQNWKKESALSGGVRRRAKLECFRSHRETELSYKGGNRGMGSSTSNLATAYRTDISQKTKKREKRSTGGTRWGRREVAAAEINTTSGP